MEFAILGAIAVGYLLAGLFFAHRLRANRFRDRSELTFDQVYAQFYLNSGLPKDVVRDLWEDAARTLRIDSGRLRPEDRFDGELSHRFNPFPIFDLNHDFYLAAVDRLRAKSADKSVLESVKTLNDYIVNFARLGQQA